MTDIFDELIEILLEVRLLVDSPDTDIAWSKFNSLDEALSDIDLHIDKAKRHDESIKYDMKVLFGPTSSLQEISISSGWGEHFLKIANIVDELIIKMC